MNTQLAPVYPDVPAWTPEALQEAVDREKALRSVVIEYYRKELKQGHHYYTLRGQGENRKPALAKEGALNLCSLFRVTPEPDEPHETLLPDGHYGVRFRYRLRNPRSNDIVATGDGSCTTREGKYAYRWLFGSEVPFDVDKEKLPQRTVKTKHGRALQWRVPNPDLADTYNTVLKMAAKRALVAATLHLPLVSELFTQDLEEQIGGEEDEEPAATSEVPSAPVLHRLQEAMTKAGVTEAQLLLQARKRFGEGVHQVPDLTDEQLGALTADIWANR